VSKTFLVIPCYNETKRLKLREFEKFPYTYVFVDDGSQDGTYDFLLKNKKSNWYVHKLEKNSGKAEAVRQGVEYALNHVEIKKEDWIGFWDADLATPLSEVQNFLDYQQIFYPTAVAVYGSRVKRLGANIKRNWKRYVLGRLFATVVSIIFKIKIYDTQCGAKLFRPVLAKDIFAKPFISKWLFDVELTLRAQDNEIVEFPVLSWIDVAGSKVKIIRETFKVIRDLHAISKSYPARKQKTNSLDDKPSARLETARYPIEHDHIHPE
jgi:dolichyl-phosphate beta-glucosyltransferase